MPHFADDPWPTLKKVVAIIDCSSQVAYLVTQIAAGIHSFRKSPSHLLRRGPPEVTPARSTAATAATAADVVPRSCPLRDLALPRGGHVTRSITAYLAYLPTRFCPLSDRNGRNLPIRLLRGRLSQLPAHLPALGSTCLRRSLVPLVPCLLPAMAPDVASALNVALAAAASSPRDVGTVEYLLLRPTSDQRQPAKELSLTIADGVAGDAYEGPPEGQVCVTNGRVLRTLVALGGGTASAAAAAAGTADALEPAGGGWDAAGDQLFLDWDLSPAHLSTDDLVRIGGDGGVLLRVSALPHNGCAKFKARYGDVALKVVNGPKGRRERLRGIYLTVVEEGVVRVGDRVVKVQSAADGA